MMEYYANEVIFGGAFVSEQGQSLEDQPCDNDYRVGPLGQPSLLGGQGAWILSSITVTVANDLINHA